MCLGEKASKIFSTWLKNQCFCFLDIDGMYGGLFTGWSLAFRALNSYAF
jgi:hypothetical protein